MNLIKKFVSSFQLMQLMLTKSIFVRESLQNCLSTCRYRPIKEEISSASRKSFYSFISLAGSLFLSKIMIFLYSILPQVSGHSQLGATISLKQHPSPYFRCCKTFNIYKLNSGTPSHTILIECHGCIKRFHTSPVKNTNLLLVTDLNPDCACGYDIVQPWELGIIEESDINNVFFGKLSYRPLPCTHNINISIACNGSRTNTCISVSMLFIAALIVYWPIT